MKLLPLLLLAALAACRQDEIETRRVPKEAPPAPAGAASAAASRPTSLTWTTPTGWTELPGSAMRVASFKLPEGAGKAEATVVVFPGDAGGELANVNRWRGQIALPPIEESGLAGVRVNLRAAAGNVLAYDFVSGGAKKTRLVAGMIRVSGSTWFFKLMGDDDAVAAAKPAFLKLLGSLTSHAP